jgi:hypothetical protein
MGGTIGSFNQLLKSREEHDWQVAVPKGAAERPPKGREFVMANKDRRARDLFPEFDFLSAFLAVFFGTQMELKPIPVKVRRR